MQRVELVWGKLGLSSLRVLNFIPLSLFSYCANESFADIYGHMAKGYFLEHKRLKTYCIPRNPTPGCLGGSRKIATQVFPAQLQAAAQKLCISSPQVVTLCLLCSGSVGDFYIKPLPGSFHGAAEGFHKGVLTRVSCTPATFTLLLPQAPPAAIPPTSPRQCLFNFHAR